MWHGLIALLLIAANPVLPGEMFWNAMQPLCGKAFVGKMTEGTEPSDEAFGAQRMVMHVSHCSANEIRIPFHVGENRSRTWVLTRDGSGVQLKHDHRHEDGSADAVTQYGGKAALEDDDLSLDFPADVYTAEMIPPAATNIWTLRIEPGERFAYALRREEQGRRFTVMFNLAKPAEAPPPAW